MVNELYKLMRRLTKDIFIQKSKKIHGSKYNYEKANYINNDIKITIICDIHGDIEIVPKNHLNGQGCRKCGYEFSVFRKNDWIKKGKNKIGVFYILKCYNDDEIFFKFGITFRGTNVRHTKASIPYNFEIVKEVKSKDLGYIWDLEKRFKHFKVKNHYIPKIKFFGCLTECFK